MLTNKNNASCLLARARANNAYALLLGLCELHVCVMHVCTHVSNACSTLICQEDRAKIEVAVTQEPVKFAHAWLNDVEKLLNSTASVGLKLSSIASQEALAISLAAARVQLEKDFKAVELVKNGNVGAVGPLVDFFVLAEVHVSNYKRWFKLAKGVVAIANSTTGSKKAR